MKRNQGQRVAADRVQIQEQAKAKCFTAINTKKEHYQDRSILLSLYSAHILFVVGTQ